MADLVARRPLAGRIHRAGAITLSEGHGPEGAESEPDQGIAWIDVAGAGTRDLLGTGVGGATRLAALRVTIGWSDEPEAARIAVERCSADYLWAWLVARASRLTSV